MADRRLTYPFHKQDLDSYCGAACVQMILAGLPGGSVLQQDVIYNENRSGTFDPAWASPPDGMANTLNSNDPRPGTHFHVNGYFYPVDLTQQVIATIEIYRVPPIVLVQDATHWILVHGYTTDDSVPAGVDPLLNFYASNPAPEIGSAFNHSTGDTCFSMGGQATDIMITRSDWYGNVLTPSIVMGPWNGQYIAICDPDPGGKEHLSMKEEETYYTVAPILLTPAQADALAPLLIKQHHLEEDKYWGNHLKHLKPLKARLVMRLNKHSEFYYIIPLVNSANNIMALMTIDAHKGTLGSIGTLRDRNGDFNSMHFQPLTHDEILKAIGSYIDKGDKGIFKIYKEAIEISPVLVWKSCLESLSQFWPFHLVYYGEHRIYVRFDKKVFTKLHTDHKGL